MGIFTIKGTATREAECDISILKITFQARGTSPAEVSTKAIEDCDGFLETIRAQGLNPKKVSYVEDSVYNWDYDDPDMTKAKREIEIRIPFDMKVINGIQETLQNSNYDYEFHVDHTYSDINSLREEVTKDALEVSRKEAEQLAKALGKRVVGVESLEDTAYTDIINMICEQERGITLRETPRPSDELAASTIEENANLTVKWIIE